MKENYNDVIKKIDAIEKTKNKHLDHVNRNIEECEKEINALTGKIQMLMSEGENPQAYIEAEKNKRTAEDSMRFYIDHKKDFERGQFVTEEEIEAIYKAVRSHQDAITGDISKKVTALREEAQRLYAEGFKAVSEGNQLLNRFKSIVPCIDPDYHNNNTFGLTNYNVSVPQL